MKEQTITARNPRRVATSSRELVQKPARRDRSVHVQRSLRNPLRGLYPYVPAALKFVALMILLVVLFLGYRAAASASLFQVKRIDVTGTSRTSAEEISGIARRAVARTGVWRADLTAVSAELQKLPAVRHATVTRVLPDGLRIRIIERAPVAVVRPSSGRLIWVDEEGVTMGEVKPSDRIPTFFIRGWAEDDSPDAAKDNFDRIQKYLKLLREWDSLGLSERVSEVNLNDLKDVRAQLAGADSQIEVRLGSKTLQEALEVLDQEKPKVNAEITYVDLTARIPAVGLSTGRKVSLGPESAPTRSDAAQTAAAPEARTVTTNRTLPIPARSDGSRERNRSEAGRGQTNTSRPRRVG